MKFESLAANRRDAPSSRPETTETISSPTALHFKRKADQSCFRNERIVELFYEGEGNEFHTSFLHDFWRKKLGRGYVDPLVAGANQLNEITFYLIGDHFQTLVRCLRSVDSFTTSWPFRASASGTRAGRDSHRNHPAAANSLLPPSRSSSSHERCSG